MVGAALLGVCCSLAIAAEVQPPSTPTPSFQLPPIKFAGYVQNRLYSAAAANAEFRVERVSISALASLQNDSKGYVEVYYQPWAVQSGLYLESAYFDGPAGDGRLRVGKGRRQTFGIVPSYNYRKTSNYGIVAESFTQDRIQGVQYMYRQCGVDLGIAAHTGYRLGTRNIGEIPGDDVRNATNSTPHLCFRDIPGALSNKAQMSTRIGGIWPKGLKGGVSYSIGGLDNRDLTNLTTSSAANPLTPGGTPALIPGATSQTMQVWGLDFTHEPKTFLVQGEFYGAKVSSLSYNGWEALVGWDPPVGWRYYARYGQQNMHLTPTANPLSWDDRQLTLSAVQPLFKGTWLQYEAEFNYENSNAGKVWNNLFFAEFFVSF